MKRKISPYNLIISIFAIIGCIQLFSFSKNILEINFENTLFYAAKSHTLPDNVNFCGEDVPLNSQDIKERLDKEIIKNTYWHSSILLFYKRSGKYFPIIEPILKKNNIPDDFKYLAIAESGLKNVVSPAGAKGFWQFMEKTGIEYGLEINKEVDERYHLEKSTQAACEYLNDAYKKFGSWTLVAASYNMGMYGLQKNLKRQKVNSYYDLLLNSETSRYVFRIVSFKTILENPIRYGYNLKESDQYKTIKYKTVSLDSNVTDFSEFAIQQDINYKILKIANPWLRQKYLKNVYEKRYLIKIITSGHHKYSKIDSIMVDSNSLLKSDSLTLNKTINSDHRKTESSLERKDE